MRWLGRSALLAAVLAGLGIGPAGAANGAEAARLALAGQPSAAVVLLIGHTIRTVSSTGVRLTIHFGGTWAAPESRAVVASGRRRAGLEVTLTEGRLAGANESHTWSFPLTGGSLRYDPASGDAVLRTGTHQLASFGAVSLAFQPRSSRTAACQGGGSTRTETGSLAIRAVFDTGTGWGTVTLGTRQPVVSAARLLVSADCARPFVLPCVRELDWFTLQHGIALNGVSPAAGRGAFISLSRQVSLTAPAGATRQDTLTAPEPRIVFDRRTGVVTESISGAGGVTGGPVRLAVIQVSIGRTSCGPAGSSHTQRVANYIGSFATPAAVHGRFAIFDAIVARAAPKRSVRNGLSIWRY